MVRADRGVSLATRYSQETAGFSNAVALTVTINANFEKEDEIGGKLKTLAGIAAQMLASCQSPLNVVQVLWQDGRDKGKGATTELRSEMPFAELRRHAAADRGAAVLFNGLTTRAGTVWRKMGDDDMPFINPNDAAKLKEAEMHNEEFGDQGNLLSFPCNLTRANQAPLLDRIFTLVYAVEAQTISYIHKKFEQPVYAIEPTTYYRAPNGRDAEPVWNEYETHAADSNKQLKEGASFAKGMQSSFGTKASYVDLSSLGKEGFIATLIPTAAGERLDKTAALLETYLATPKGTIDREAMREGIAKSLAEVDQSIWDEETLTRGMGWMISDSNKESKSSNKEAKNKLFYMTEKINVVIRKILIIF